MSHIEQLCGGVTFELTVANLVMTQYDMGATVTYRSQDARTDMTHNVWFMK
jgi:hypothetical protein